MVALTRSGAIGVVDRAAARSRAALGWALARPVLTAAVLYGLLTLVFFAPTLMPGKTLSNSDLLWFETPWAGVKPATLERAANPEFGDHAYQFQVWQEYARDLFPGEFPHWNPYIMGGRPFHGNSQSALFSPFSLPLYVLPFWLALSAIAMLKVWVACFGAFLLGRALGMRFGGALLAGLVYGFGLFMIFWLWATASGIWALVPWLWLLTDSVVRRPGPLPVAGLAVVVCLQFLAGHPESNFHVLAATLFFLTLRLVQERRAGRLGEAGMRPALIGFGAALAGGLALAAVALVPVLELILRSADIEQRSGIGSKLEFRYLWEVLVPDWWGRPTGSSFNLFLSARAFYAGALTLMVAAAALILRPRFERVGIAAFGAVCLLVALGVPPFYDIVHALPGFDTAHNTRLPIFWQLSLALLAGWGLDELTEHIPRGPRATAIVAVSVALLCVPVLWILSERPPPTVIGPAVDMALRFFEAPNPFATPDALAIVRLAGIIVWLLVAGAAVWLLRERLAGRLAAGVFVALALALVAVDLFRAGMGYNPAVDRDLATQPATGAIRYLQSRRPARFAGIGQQTLQQNVAMRYRLYDARGYDFPVEKRFSHLWRRKISPEFGEIGSDLRSLPLFLTGLNEQNLRLLSLLGVSDILQPPGQPPPAVQGLSLAYRGPDGVVWANERALPRAFVTGSQRVVGSEDAALDAIAEPGFDPRSTAIVERPVAGVERATAGSRGDAAGDARIASYEPGRVVVQARAERAGLLVLSDLHYPGWTATIDGRETGIHRVDYLLRGVPLAAGSHTVEFTYEPTSFRLGALVSILALGGLGAAVAVGMRRRRRT